VKAAFNNPLPVQRVKLLRTGVFREWWSSGFKTTAIESEDGCVKKEVQSVNGQYTVALPPGRYAVTAFHEGYETFTTGSGYFVNPGGGYQTANIFLEVKGGVLCPSSGHLPSTARQNPSQRDAPPRLNMTIHPSVVAAGEEFNVTLEGSDDTGLAMIWWWAESGDEGFKKAQAANARDISYPTPGEAHQASEGMGMACAVLVVK